jgi:hypothetical protein
MARLGSAARFAAARFGTQTRLRDRVVNVGTTIGEILGNNPDRLSWRVVNRSVNNGAIGFDRESTFANGYLVAAAGGTAAMDVEKDGEAVAQAVFAINDAAAGDWRVLEVLADVRGAEA